VRCGSHLYVHAGTRVQKVSQVVPVVTKKMTALLFVASPLKISSDSQD
jgi:hypothetical protein